MSSTTCFRADQILGYPDLHPGETRSRKKPYSRSLWIRRIKTALTGLSLLICRRAGASGWNGWGGAAFRGRNPSCTRCRLCRRSRPSPHGTRGTKRLDEDPIPSGLHLAGYGAYHAVSEGVEEDRSGRLPWARCRLYGERPEPNAVNPAQAPMAIGSGRLTLGCLKRFASSRGKPSRSGKTVASWRWSYQGRQETWSGFLWAYNRVGDDA